MILRGIFQGDALSSLLYVIAMMPLKHIHRKCTAGYKLRKSQETISHSMYMDENKLFAQNEKELEVLIQTVRIYNQDKGMEFGIEKCGMLVMRSGKRHMTEGVEQPNQNCENIQSRYRNGIWYRKMWHASHEKWQTTHDGRSRTTKSKLWEYTIKIQEWNLA